MYFKYISIRVGQEQTYDSPKGILYLQKFSFKDVPSWNKTLKEKGEICAQNINDLPQDLINALKSQGIKSIYVLPIIVNDLNYGFWGFDYCDSFECGRH